MMPPSSHRRGIAGMSVIALAMIAVLLSLGVWQLQRRTAKHALIAAMHQRLDAKPVALPPVAEWPALDRADDEFRRVRFSASYERLPDAMVYSSGSAVRGDVAGPGTWAFLPARLPGGGLVAINTGFVPNPMQDRDLEDRAVKPLLTAEPVEFIGYLRFPEVAGMLTPPVDQAKRLWFTRDLAAMVGVLGWDRAGRVAPFYIDLESPVPGVGAPKPGPLSVQLRDEHMQYALTWFGLASAVAVAFLVWLRGQRRAAAATPVTRAPRRMA
jgi:surfeit locus 1 family protein